MTDNDFDTQRAALANRFASVGADLLEYMGGTACALAAIPNTQPQQYAVAGDPKAIRALLPADEAHPARRMRKGDRPTEPLEWDDEPGAPRRFTALLMKGTYGLIEAFGHTFPHALAHYERVNVVEILPGQVANKAEVEPILQARSPEGDPWQEVSGEDFFKAHDNGYEVSVCVNAPGKNSIRLEVTPPATTGASTVLTDERTSIHCQEFHELAMDYRGAPAFNGAPEAYRALVAYIDQQFAREVAAQAGQVAVPAWISVDERLPELQKEVLICCGYLVLGYRTDDKHDPENHNGWVIDFDNGMASPITHWMPLPPSPAKESK